MSGKTRNGGSRAPWWTGARRCKGTRSRSRVTSEIPAPAASGPVREGVGTPSGTSRVPRPGQGRAPRRVRGPNLDRNRNRPQRPNRHRDRLQGPTQLGDRPHRPSRHRDRDRLQGPRRHWDRFQDPSRHWGGVGVCGEFKGNRDDDHAGRAGQGDAVSMGEHAVPSGGASPRPGVARAVDKCPGVHVLAWTSAITALRSAGVDDEAPPDESHFKPLSGRFPRATRGTTRIHSRSPSGACLSYGPKFDTRYDANPQSLPTGHPASRTDRTNERHSPDQRI
jgi:hypothetical protein